MTRGPSRVAVACLRACLPRDAADAVIGDLHEELAMRAGTPRGPLLDALFLEWRAWRYLITIVPATLVTGGRRSIDELSQDLRGALRTDRRSPMLPLTIVGLLALGVGAATTIAALVYGVLLRPLPVADQDRLVGLFATSRSLSRERDPVSAVRADQWRTRRDLFDGLATAASARFDLIVDGAADRLDGEAVSDNFFTVLQPVMVAGRPFGDADTASGDVPCVVSERLWRHTLSADAHVIGRRLDTATFGCVIVGVAPEAFGRWRAPAELWVPFRRVPSVMPSKALTSDGWRWFRVVARLAPGVTLDRTRAVMAPFDAALDETLAFAPDADRGVDITPLRGAGVTAPVRRSLVFVALLTILVVAVVTANVAGMLLARNLGRSREMALRRAIGASTARLVRQMAVEAGVLALAGGGMGVLIATRTAPALLVLAPPDWRGAIVAVDTPVAMSAMLIVTAIALVIGILPAVRMTDRTAALLRNGSRGTAGPGARRAQAWLVGTQTAIAVPVLVAASLLVAGFAKLHAIDPGFASDHLLLAQVAMSPSYATPTSAHAFRQRLLEEASALPGVAVAAIGSAVVSYLGPASTVPAGSSITIEGRGRFLNGEASQAPFTPGRILVTPDYFTALGLRAVRGRVFDDGDARDGAAPVAVVNETMTRLHWPGQDPVGRRVSFEAVRSNQPNLTSWIQIVGVVSDARQDRFERAPRPQIYQPFAPVGQLTGSPWLLVRTQVSAGTMIPPLHRAIRNADPRAPVLTVRTMASVIDEATAASRYAASYVAALAGLGLMLAASAIYALGAFAAASRTSEVAIRMALGADRASVLRLIVAQALRPVTIGLSCGAGLALTVARNAGVHVYEVRAGDPIFLLVAVAALGVVATVAAYLPARSAARVDPLIALRGD